MQINLTLIKNSMSKNVQQNQVKPFTKQKHTSVVLDPNLITDFLNSLFTKIEIGILLLRTAQ